MDLTLLGHSCVRFDSGGRRLVIDPGAFSAADALDGADAVLVTHEHPDHVVPDRLRAALADRPELQVWAPQPVATALTEDDDTLTSRVHVASAGDHFEAAGFPVDVVGEKHAVIHPELPRAANVGYVVDGTVLHPGDALTVPDRAIELLLVPIVAPWVKAGEVIDYVRAVGARRAVPIHDAILADSGRALLDGLLGARGPGIGGTEYGRVPTGETFSL